jgi:hypothetical protein
MRSERKQEKTATCVDRSVSLGPVSRGRKTLTHTLCLCDLFELFLVCYELTRQHLKLGAYFTALKYLDSTGTSVRMSVEL